MQYTVTVKVVITLIIKKCQICGKEFTTNSNNQRYCKGPHTSKCVICGKEFPVKSVQQLKTKKCCSKACTQELRKRTNLERFGKPYAIQNDECKKKAKNSFLKHYGVEHYQQLPDAKIKMNQKREATNLKRYGVKNVSLNTEVRKRQLEGLIRAAQKELDKLNKETK